MSDQRVRAFRNRAGCILVDHRHFPIVLVRWSGRIDETLLVRFYDWKLLFASTLGERERYVLVHDLVAAARPSANARKLATTLRLKTSKQTDKRHLGMIAVASNPIIRGAIRAIGWMTGGLVADVESTREDAISRALELLVQHGLSPPLDLAPGRYTFPPPTADPRIARAG